MSRLLFKQLFVVLSALCLMLPSALSNCLPENQKAAGPEFDSIELIRRNWENHGTDIGIAGDGSYVVTAHFLGKSKQVRKGNIPDHLLNDLGAALGDANIFDLKDRYADAPLQLEPSWWGYELTVKKGQRIKTIKFHSADASVPESLKNIVDDIMRLTR